MSANHPFICRNDTFLYVQFSFLKHCAYDLVRFRHKTHSVGVWKTSWFALKWHTSSADTKAAGNGPPSCEGASFVHYINGLSQRVEELMPTWKPSGL